MDKRLINTNNSFKNWDIHTYEKLLKSPKKFRSFLLEEMKREDIHTIVGIVKSSGICLDIHQSKKYDVLLKEIIKDIQDNYGVESQNIIKKLLHEKNLIEALFIQMGKLKDYYFNEIANIDADYEVLTFILALEILLSQCSERQSRNSIEEIQKKYPYVINMKSYSPISKFTLYSGVYDSAVDSAGQILNYFYFNKYAFKGVNRNMQPLKVKEVTAHFDFNGTWDILSNIMEAWKYSEIKVTPSPQKKKVLLEPIDKWLQLNNLVSNERFVNLRNGWMMGRVSDVFQGNQSVDISNYNVMKEINEEQEELSYRFAELYFGSFELSEKIKGIQLKKWLQAYILLIQEAKLYLKRRNKSKIQNLNLRKICLCKKPEEWVRFFERQNFSKEEANTILKMLTFNKKSQDLIDCPFIKIEDYLVIIPSITAHADAARGLASNFTNQGINLNFKGYGFEKRINIDLSLAGVVPKNLHKKTSETEYECDIAFVLDNELFFVECKSQMQPYTTRQHCILLNNLTGYANQLNRIADYFTGDMDFVIKHLGLAEDFVPSRINKIILTTTMIGQPMFINGCYVIDESALNTFLTRKKPSVQQIASKKVGRIYSSNFNDVYDGEISAEKLRRFIETPPQVEIMKDFFNERTIELPMLGIEISHIEKVMDTIHVGEPLNNLQKQHLKDHFRISQEFLNNDRIL
ncbi:hypothetical protein [Bacillus cereus]|uniref:hypothetical protein n=1 Tax=Bacillus cereus TaxID=1396 RepID=UPI000776E0D5|nr:hypothetical protein [Bacillus cereus]UUE91519.1 hypothetical protein L2I54_13365 [Bacillus cereus]